MYVDIWLTGPVPEGGAAMRAEPGSFKRVRSHRVDGVSRTPFYLSLQRAADAGLVFEPLRAREAALIGVAGASRSRMSCSGTTSG